MFALASLIICGFLALAVDVGLAYSIRKSAQSAADLAALAGAQQALSAISTPYPSSCPSTAGCQSTISTSCVPTDPPQNSIQSACLYALKNGFVNGSNNGYTQTVGVAAYTQPKNSAPTCPAPPNTFYCAQNVLDMDYWVEVQISEQIPYLFGGALNFLVPGVNVPFLTVKVSAVAAIVVTGPKAAQKSTISLVQ
jgi:uncharacterized membrane protein